MSAASDREAEVRLQVTLYDMEAPDVSREKVSKLVAQYATEAIISPDLSEVLRDELARWLERFNSPEDPPPSGDQVYFSRRFLAWDAYTSRQRELLREIQRSPHRKDELMEYHSAEIDAWFRAGLILDPPAPDEEDDQLVEDDDADWEEPPEPVPAELNVGRSGPTVSGGLPSLGRRSR